MRFASRTKSAASQEQSRKTGGRKTKSASGKGGTGCSPEQGMSAINHTSQKSLRVLVDQVDESDWRAYAGSFSDYSIYQTWAYQCIRAQKDGQSISRAVVLDSDGNALTMCQIRTRRLPLLGLRVGYVQGGPLLRQTDDKVVCPPEALSKLREAYIGKRLDVLRVVPNQPDGETGQEVTKLLTAVGFEHIKSIPAYHTYRINVDGGEEEILRGLRKSFRRDMRYARKSKVVAHESTAEEYCQIMNELYGQAKKRKGFKGLDGQLFCETQQMLRPDEKMSIITAHLNDRVVAALMASNLGDTSMVLLAASNEEGLSCFASYLIWYEGALAAHRAGMKWYDLGGIDPAKNPNVCQFKSRMGGEECFHIGLFAAYSGSFVRRLWHIAEKAYHLAKK